MVHVPSGQSKDASEDGNKVEELLEGTSKGNAPASAEDTVQHGAQPGTEREEGMKRGEGHCWPLLGRDALKLKSQTL